MIRVVSAVIIAHGSILMAMRLPDKDYGGKWETPGGKVEGSETDEQALSRELKEELFVESTVHERLHQQLHSASRGYFRMVFYRVTVTGRPLPLASQAVAWFNPEVLKLVVSRGEAAPGTAEALPVLLEQLRVRAV